MDRPGESLPRPEQNEETELERKLLDGRHSMLVIKPSGKELEAACPALVDKYKIQEVLESIFEAVDLKILREGERQINEAQIREIYPILDAPSEFGDEWKKSVINHMAAQPIGYYLLEGDNANQKTQELKKAVREKWLDKNSVQSYVVENLIHVSDQEDLITTYKVLVQGKE